MMGIINNKMKIHQLITGFILLLIPYSTAQTPVQLCFDLQSPHHGGYGDQIVEVDSRHLDWLLRYTEVEYNSRIFPSNGGHASFPR